MSRFGPLRGVYDVVTGGDNWETRFDLSRRGLQRSFYIILLLFPAFYICVYAVGKARASALDQLDIAFDPVKFFALTGVLIFSFSISAYVTAMIIDRQDRFRPWVIVRHWSTVLLMILPALAFGLSILTAMPINIAFYLAMIAFLFSLVVDIRIIQEVLNFDLGKSVLLACVLTAITLMILATGLSQIA